MRADRLLAGIRARPRRPQHPRWVARRPTRGSGLVRALPARPRTSSSPATVSPSLFARPCAHPLVLPRASCGAQTRPPHRRCAWTSPRAMPAASAPRRSDAAVSRRCGRRAHRGRARPRAARLARGRRHPSTGPSPQPPWARRRPMRRRSGVRGALAGRARAAPDLRRRGASSRASLTPWLLRVAGGVRRLRAPRGCRPWTTRGQRRRRRHHPGLCASPRPPRARARAPTIRHLPNLSVCVASEIVFAVWVCVL